MAARTSPLSHTENGTNSVGTHVVLVLAKVLLTVSLPVDSCQVSMSQADFHPIAGHESVSARDAVRVTELEVVDWELPVEDMLAVGVGGRVGDVDGGREAVVDVL